MIKCPKMQSIYLCSPVLFNVTLMLSLCKDVCSTMVLEEPCFVSLCTLSPVYVYLMAIKAHLTWAILYSVEAAIPVCLIFKRFKVTLLSPAAVNMKQCLFLCYCTTCSKKM